MILAARISGLLCFEHKKGSEGDAAQVRGGNEHCSQFQVKLEFKPFLLVRTEGFSSQQSPRAVGKAEGLRALWVFTISGLGEQRTNLCTQIPGKFTQIPLGRGWGAPPLL